MSDIDQALECLEVHSATFPHFTIPTSKAMHFFKNGDPRLGLNDEITAWYDLQGLTVLLDYFVRVSSLDTKFYFRSEEMASIFRLRFL